MHFEYFAVLASIAATAKCVLAASVISKRSSDTYAANCNAAPPANSGYKPPEFPSMKSVLQAAFIDATSLASMAFDITQNIGEVQANNAYNHYYDSQFTNAEEMLGHVNGLSLWINAGSNNQVPSRWSVNFDCSGKLKGCSDSPTSLAVTDGQVGATLVEICPLFWTAPSTAFLLPGNGPQPSVNSKPYRSLDGSGWCNRRQTANFFATAGHTILHELSHLDSIGQLGGLAPDEDGEHGTGDFQKRKEDGCELNGARRYLRRWRADTRNTVASPDYNAESLAGFSTEYFFSTQCPNLDNIPE